MSYLLILLLILLHTMQSFLCKKYTSEYPGNPSMASPVFTIVSGVTITIISLAFSSFRLTIHTETMIFALANTLFLYLYNYAVVRAAQSGPYSVQMVFSMGGSNIMAALASTLVFKDTISPLKIASIILLLIAIYMVTQKKDNEQKITKTFILACILIFIGNGMYGVLFDAQQRITGPAEKEEMIALTYFMTVILAVISNLKQPSKLISAMKQSKKSMVYLLTCSVVTALAINLLTIILPMLDVTLFYTLDNVGVLLLSVLCSAFLLKEKLSFVNITGFAVMILGLVIMSMA